jgi:hypothetical protein
MMWEDRAALNLRGGCGRADRGKRQRGRGKSGIDINLPEQNSSVARTRGVLGEERILPAVSSFSFFSAGPEGSGNEGGEREGERERERARGSEIERVKIERGWAGRMMLVPRTCPAGGSDEAEARYKYRLACTHSGLHEVRPSVDLRFVSYLIITPVFPVLQPLAGNKLVSVLGLGWVPERRIKRRVWRGRSIFPAPASKLLG